MASRLEILAEAFDRKLSSKEVNHVLLENECEELYVRNFFEASLMYAFDHQMSYDDWLLFYKECEQIYTDSKEKVNTLFSSKVMLSDLKSYVENSSDTDFHTLYRTRMMEEDLSQVNEKEQFKQFLLMNIQRFSSVREKARYYFCKYLYLYIVDKCEAYYQGCEQTMKLLQSSDYTVLRNFEEKEALSELTFLKPLTALKKDAEKLKGKMSMEERRALIEKTSLTPGAIFDAFNHYYYDYISTDWIELLFDFYGDYETWNYEEKIKLVKSLGLCPMQATPLEEEKGLLKLRHMAEKQMEKEDQLYSLDDIEIEKEYQRGRSGEDFIRSFISGKKDLNRATLITFLIFVNQSVNLEKSNQINIQRLNRILENCGFKSLQPGHSFDAFIMQILQSKAPLDMIMDKADEQARCGSNFYFYKVYIGAYNHQEELLKFIMRGKKR